MLVGENIEITTIISPVILTAGRQYQEVYTELILTLKRMIYQSEDFESMFIYIDGNRVHDWSDVELDSRDLLA
jgi:hypothetical protein